MIIEERLEDKNILGELKIVETEVEKVTERYKTPLAQEMDEAYSGSS